MTDVQPAALGKKKLKQQAIEELWKHFHDRFPLAFPSLKTPMPLAISIREALRALGYPEDDLATLLRWYCRRYAYLNAITQGTHRVDLEGNPAGEIDDNCRELAEKAKEAIKTRRQAKTEARKQHKLREREAQTRKKAQAEAEAAKLAKKAAEEQAKKAKPAKETKPERAKEPTAPQVTQKPPVVIIQKKRRMLTS